jgi:hypothetical protein
MHNTIDTGVYQVRNGYTAVQFTDGMTWRHLGDDAAGDKGLDHVAGRIH